MNSDAELTRRIKGLALALGFDLAGVAEAAPTPETEFLLDWIERGYAGCMEYLTRRAAERSPIPVRPRSWRPSDDGAG